MQGEWEQPTPSSPTPRRSLLLTLLSVDKEASGRCGDAQNLEMQQLRR